MKTTSRGRGPLNRKTGISQEPLPFWTHCMTKLYCTNPLNEDNLNISASTLLDHFQILNFSLNDQTILYKSLKWRQPEYLSIHLLDHTQILNFSLNNQTIFLKSSKLRRPPMEEKLNLLKVEHLSNHCMDCVWRVVRGKLEENPEEISSVALLSPACVYYLLL
jgi:hypothetical protein